MKNIEVIIQKEVLFLLKNPLGYIFAGLLMVIAGWMYFYNFFVAGVADMTNYWMTLIMIMGLFIPAISMNLLAEEKKQGNWEVLLSLPVNEQQVVLGKYLGSLAYLALTILLSLPIVVTLMSLGKPDMGIIFCQFLGTLLLGGVYLSMGIWFSSLTNQPIVAFLATAATLTVLSITSQIEIINRLPNFLQDMAVSVSLVGRTQGFLSGLIRFNDVLFMLSCIGGFITLAIMSLKTRGK